MALKATVKNGHLILDDPVDLPEGTVLDLVVDDEGNTLTEEEIERLNAAISRSWQQAELGQSSPAEQILLKLRDKRGS